MVDSTDLFGQGGDDTRRQGALRQFGVVRAIRRYHPVRAPHSHRETLKQVLVVDRRDVRNRGSEAHKARSPAARLGGLRCREEQPLSRPLADVRLEGVHPARAPARGGSPYDGDGRVVLPDRRIERGNREGCPPQGGPAASGVTALSQGSCPAKQ